MKGNAYEKKMVIGNEDIKPFHQESLTIKKKRKLKKHVNKFKKMPMFKIPMKNGLTRVIS